MCKVLISCILSALVLLSSASPAVSRDRKGRAAKEQAAPVSQPTEYERLFQGKSCHSERGLLTLHDVDGRLLVEMPLSFMGKDVLIGSTISAVTDNRFMSVGEKPRSPMQVTFQLDGSKVNLCKRRYDLMAEGEDLKESLRRNTMLGIMSAFDIKAWSPDSSAVVVDMTDFFLGNNPDLDPFPKDNPSNPVQVSRNFKRELSSLEGIKAFEDNVSVKSRLSYSVTMRNASKRVVYMTDAPFTVEVTRSMILLPDAPFRVRYADPRIGVFFQHKSVFVGSDEGVKDVYYARRWRLEPSDSAAYLAGECVEPVTPIVFYIDDAFPESWKPYVAKGVEVWNRAFERIGFKNAVRTQPFPTDCPEFDPDNLKYNCVRYSPSEMTNSAGPHWTDPRTGEIINASVYVYHNIVRLLQDWLFVQTAAVDPSVRGLKIPQDLIGDCIAYVVSHEVGHCLGLMHNMAGSSSIPVDSLRSASFTSRYGTTYSIMDYARFNFIAQPGDLEKGVKLMPPALGEYDFYAIEWLYRPFLSLSSAEEEVPVLREFITERSGNPIYRYGKQQIAARVDPSAFEEDLGDDPMRAAELGISNLKVIADNLDNWLSEEDYDYSFRQRMHSQIVAQYQRYVTRVLYNIGGIYLNERFEGDALRSYELVPAQQQKQSVKFLLEQTKDLAWLDDCSVGRGWPLSAPLAHNMGVALFRTVIKSCGNLWYSAPLMGAQGYGQQEFLDDVASFVWKPTRAGKSLSLLEMDLQSQFISWLMTNSEVATPFAQGKPGHVSFAYEDESMYMGFASFKGMQGAVPAMKHLCFGKLREALTILKKSSSTGDAQTRQHYQMLVRKLEKELE